MADPPILSHKHFTQKSVFTAENLLREARRQKRLGHFPTAVRMKQVTVVAALT